MKKFYLISLAFFMLFLQACSTEYENTSYSSNSEKFELKTGSISPHGSFAGNLFSENETVLSPKTFGRVVDINYDEGDSVSQGEVIARVDSTYASISYNSIDNVISSMEGAKASTRSMFESQIQAARAGAEQAQRSIDMLYSELDGASSQVVNIDNINKTNLDVAKQQINIAESSRDTIKKELENAKDKFDQEEENIYSNATSSISNTEILSKNILNFADEILGITPANRNKNNAFETYLSARKSSLKSRTENQWSDLNSQFQDIKDMYDDLEELTKDRDGKLKIQDILNEYENYLSDLRSYMSDFYDMIDASVSSITFPQEKIDELKGKTNEFQKNIEEALIKVEGNYMVGVKGSLQSIYNLFEERKSTIDRLESNLKEAENQIAKAESAYENYDAIGESESTDVLTKKEVLEKQILVYEEQYNEAKENVQALESQMESEILNIDSKINELEGERQASAQEIQDTNIVAPFDGIITQKNLEIGQLVGPESGAIVLADNNDLKISVNIPQSLSENISQGDNVNIDFSNRESLYSGYIDKIYPNIDHSSKRVAVDIKLSQDYEDLRLGMYGTVKFDYNNIKGIKLPYRYIKYNYGSPYIELYGDNYPQRVFVDLLGCDGGYCIVEGDINPGDKIIR